MSESLSFKLEPEPRRDREFRVRFDRPDELDAAGTELSAGGRAAAASPSLPGT